MDNTYRMTKLMTQKVVALIVFDSAQYLFCACAKIHLVPFFLRKLRKETHIHVYLMSDDISKTL